MSQSSTRAGSRTDPGPTTRHDLADLSEAERAVWVSCEVHGLRPAELASVSQDRDSTLPGTWTASTVRTILSRARRKRGDAE